MPFLDISESASHTITCIYVLRIFYCCQYYARIMQNFILIFLLNSLPSSTQFWYCLVLWQLLGQLSVYIYAQAFTSSNLHENLKNKWVADVVVSNFIRSEIGKILWWARSKYFILIKSKKVSQKWKVILSCLGWLISKQLSIKQFEVGASWLGLKTWT